MLQRKFSSFCLSKRPRMQGRYAQHSSLGQMTAVLGASFVFFFETMNRAFLDEMLGFTGGGRGSGELLELAGAQELK